MFADFILGGSVLFRSSVTEFGSSGVSTETMIFLSVFFSLHQSELFLLLPGSCKHVSLF